MEFAVFCALAMRLPAYSGALAAVAARQAREKGGGPPSRRAPSQPRYESSQPKAYTPRTADSAPPATAERLAAELRLMAQWLELDQVRVMPRGDLAAAVAGELR